MEKQKKLLVMANWKMYGSLTIAEEFLKNVTSNLSKDVRLVFFLPYPFLFLAKKFPSLRFGGQNLCHLSKTAVTGEVSAPMLVDLKCDFVLVGHSERRRYFGENNNDILAQKLKRAEEAGLVPVFCVGEKSKNDWEEELHHQLVPVQQQKIPSLILAYEPVWAIGGDKASATSEHIQEASRFIKSQVKADQFIYGGSVSSENISHIAPLVDGVLVGSASWNWKELSKIMEQPLK